MRKRFLLMATAIVTALFVSGQSVAVNAEEKPATESAEVITEETKSVQNEEVKGEKEQSVEKQTEKEQPKKRGTRRLAGDSGRDKRICKYAEKISRRFYWNSHCDQFGKYL